MSYISVHCSAGKFTGVNNDDINFFYGIPFAKPLTNKTQWQAPEKIDSQIRESMQIIVLLIAAFSVMAQFYPLVGDSTLASVLMVSAMLLCFKIMSSLERSRGLFK